MLNLNDMYVLIIICLLLLSGFIHGFTEFKYLMVSIYMQLGAFFMFTHLVLDAEGGLAWVLTQYAMYCLVLFTSFLLGTVLNWVILGTVDDDY